MDATAKKAIAWGIAFSPLYLVGLVAVVASAHVALLAFRDRNYRGTLIMFTLSLFFLAFLAGVGNDHFNKTIGGTTTGGYIQYNSDRATTYLVGSHGKYTEVPERIWHLKKRASEQSFYFGIVTTFVISIMLIHNWFAKHLLADSAAEQ